MRFGEGGNGDEARRSGDAAPATTAETARNARRLAEAVCPVVDGTDERGAAYSALRHRISMPPAAAMRGRTPRDRENAWCSLLMHEVAHALGGARPVTTCKMALLLVITATAMTATTMAATGQASWTTAAMLLAGAATALVASTLAAAWHHAYEEIAADLAGQRIERALGWDPDPSWRRSSTLSHAMRIPEVANLRSRTLGMANRAADDRTAKALLLFGVTGSDTRIPDTIMARASSP